MGRCPQGCHGSLSVPLDEALGIAPYQRSSDELVRLGCLLSVVMPYELARWMLGQWSGVQVSASTLWNWVEQTGRAARAEVLTQLQASAGAMVPESLAQDIATLPLAIAADGVMVPMRPVAGTPKGKIQWREVKVGVLARLGQRVKRSGETVTRLVHRRLVAVLGDIDTFIPHLQQEAQRQSFDSAPRVIWLSDGGRGFWRVYQQCFAHCATGILDFYHAAGHLWRATTALFENPRSAEARAWFKHWRHQLRQGQHHTVLASLTYLINANLLQGKTLLMLLRVQAYFQRHHTHIHYQRFEKQHLPLGSGMVESACKWLIQQRFKGVGMRWSEDGLNHLLVLRLAWANERFDNLFPRVRDVKQKYSPIP